MCKKVKSKLPDYWNFDPAAATIWGKPKEYYYPKSDIDHTLNKVLTQDALSNALNLGKEVNSAWLTHAVLYEPPEDDKYMLI